MAFRWVLERVEFSNKKIELHRSEGVYTVGRGKENIIKCLSLYVSRKHCKIVQRAGSLAIVDLSSANGTFVNKTRILSEREIPLQDGDLIGIGVSETTDSDCFVFRLYQENCQNIVPQIPALPDSSTHVNEVVTIRDSDSENGQQEDREAEAKEIKKLPTEKEHVSISKVQKLENATVNCELSSDLSVAYFSGKKQRKRLCEDPDDKKKIKKHALEHNSRPPDDMSAIQSEVCDRTSKYEGVYELEKVMHSFCTSRTPLDIAHESKIVSAHLSSGAVNSESVEPVSLPSEFRNRTNTSSASDVPIHSVPTSFGTAASIQKEFGKEPCSSVFTNSSTTTSRQTTGAESEILNCSGSDSVMMNTTVVSVPSGVAKYKSKVVETAVQHTVESGDRTEMLNSKANKNKCPPVTKKEAPFVDNLLGIPALLTCGLNEKRSEQNLKTALCKEPNNKEISISDAKHASKHSERQSPTDNNFTGGLGNVAAHTSITSEADIRNEDAVTSGSGMYITAGDTLMPEVSVEMEKNGVPSFLCGRNKSSGSNSIIGTKNNEQFSAAWECNLEETSVQTKEWDKTRKSNRTLSILPESCSLEFSHTVSKQEQVSKSEQGVFFSNKEVKAQSHCCTTFKRESTTYLKKPVNKKLKITEQSLDDSDKSGSSVVTKELDAVYAKQSESSVMATDDKVQTSNKSQLLKNAPALSIVSSGELSDDSEDADDDLVSLQLQEVLYGDKSKAKSKTSHFKYQDKHAQTVTKTEGSSGSAKQPAIKLEPLPTASPLSDNEQLVAKQKKSKLQRRRIVSVSSSSSNEDVELQGDQKKFQSPGRTKDHSNSDVHLLTEKRKLFLVSESSNDSDCVSAVENNAESVDESKSDTITQNAVDEYREKNNAQESKHSVDNSDSVEKIAVNEEVVTRICKNNAVVKLERLDENMLKSNGWVVSEPESQSLNYTLDEDIIVLGDDDDEYFPSSQIFDDQNNMSLKTECQDAAHDDPSFNKDLEDDDDVVFEDDDSDLDSDQWFRRLSQQDLEPEQTSELPPQQVQAQTKMRDKDSGRKSLKAVNVPQVISDDAGIEQELLASDFMKTDEGKLKQKQPVSKCKYNAKTLVIDAPPMPRRRAFQRGISAEVATRMYKEQTEIFQQPVKHRNPVSDTICKKETKPKEKEGHVSLCISDDPSVLTAKQKKQIADKRKEKLKAISEKEKAVAAALKKHAVKVPAEVRVKVTSKNRGAFLMEGADTKDAEKVSATAQLSVLSSAVKKVHLDVEKACSSLNIPKQGGVKSSVPRPKKRELRSSSHHDVEKASSSLNITKRDGVKSSVAQPKKREVRSSSAPARSIKDLPRIPKISEQSSASKNVDLEVCPSAEVETITEDMPPSSPIVKTLASTRSTKRKKNVCFKKDSELVEIREIPLAENSRRIPVAHMKDAPTPRKILNNQLQQKGPDLEEVLYDILCWNPKWLEEQKNKTVTYPPPVYGSKLWPMLSSFVSYKDYLRVLTPLLLLELWTNITKECESTPLDSRKCPVVVGIDQVDAAPRLTPNKKQLMHITCHALLTEYDSQKQLHPRVGDLVYLELELDNDEPQNHHSIQPQPNAKQRRIVPIFAYVKYLNKDAVIGRTSVHKEILKHCTEPSTKLTLILLAKFRPYDVKMSHAMRVKVVSYIRSDLRLFQAMAHLPSSPLCNHILKPAEQNFSLPDITCNQFVPLIKQDYLNEPQKRAILQTAHACLMSEPKICMIQGPPGTGKSHVIVNLIIQILYAQKQNRKHSSRRNVPRILVCAPSNAAIDELVIRLLHVRQAIQKEERFRMVRTGRQETMNPLVKDISVVELAKRDARNTAQILECMESLDLEIRTLEARRNSLLMALETARQKNVTETIAETEFKVGEIETKLFKMKKSKTQNTSLDPRELWRMEKEAQSRILLGADIVATTLSSCFNNQMETIFTVQKNSKERSGYQFTCCIVDEATQSRELETLIPLMLGVTTLVLVGDAKQLPATVLSKLAKENGLGKSLFARLQTCFEDTVKNPVQFLGIQYRMHPDICLWPNRYFYSGRLHSAPNLLQQRVCSLMPYCILSLEYKQNDSGELSNAGEAELVSQLTLGLLEKLGSQQLSIGIITPYNKQRAMILSILHASSCAWQNVVEVNTIDSFQGQERDVIVMSCVRTGGIGFLADTQRLNVALTRARYSLLLCGNFTSLRNDNMWRALLENAIQRNVLKHVPSSVANNKEELLKLVLRDK